jgi:hypothetical protein
VTSWVAYFQSFSRATGFFLLQPGNIVPGVLTPVLAKTRTQQVSLAVYGNTKTATPIFRGLLKSAVGRHHSNVLPPRAVERPCMTVRVSARPGASLIHVMTLFRVLKEAVRIFLC